MHLEDLTDGGKRDHPRAALGAALDNRQWKAGPYSNLKMILAACGYRKEAGAWFRFALVISRFAPTHEARLLMIIRAVRSMR